MNTPDASSRSAESTLAFVRRTNVDGSMWDNLVQHSPDGWVFGLSAWQRVILGVAEWKLLDFSFAITRGEDLLAVVPLQLDQRSGRMASSGFGLTGPIISASVGTRQRKRLLKLAFDKINDIAGEAGARFVEVGTCAVTSSALGSRWGINPFVDYGFEDASGHTMVIDLRQSEDALWMGFAQSARQTIRRAEQAGYYAERASWADLIDVYYRAHVETYRRTGVDPHPRAYFEGIASEIAPTGCSSLWVARTADGQPVAFHNDARLGDGVLYHTGCSFDEALNVGANYLVFWAAIRGARDDGCCWYECGEVFPGIQAGKQRGLSVFKSKFGGEMHRCFRGHRMPAGGDASPEKLHDAGGPVREATLGWLMATRTLLVAVLGEHLAAAVVRPFKEFRKISGRERSAVAPPGKTRERTTSSSAGQPDHDAS